MPLRKVSWASGEFAAFHQRNGKIIPDLGVSFSSFFDGISQQAFGLAPKAHPKMALPDPTGFRHLVPKASAAPN